MTQSRERRMYLMYQAERRSSDRWNGRAASALMHVAQRFRVPIREVRDVIEAQRGEATR